MRCGRNAEKRWEGRDGGAHERAVRARFRAAAVQSSDVRASGRHLCERFDAERCRTALMPARSRGSGASSCSGADVDVRCRRLDMDLALFDFDGTITDGDGFLPFIHRAVSRPRVLAGTLWLSPLIAGYHAGWVSASRMRQSIAWVAFRGRAQAEVAELGERYAETLEQRVRPEANERIAWHQARGDRVVVVSASLDCYLVPWCRARGLELICSELELRAGVCTGRYRGGDCTGPEKARRVLERCELGAYQQVFAYGDTPEDRELLGLAQRRFFRWQELAPEPGPLAAAFRPPFRTRRVG